ncbi:MAG: HAD-IA family hydrolase [Actinomycetota bacterium]|nr:HAD-IA family hydrolase [Actinomycetota bacterium]
MIRPGEVPAAILLDALGTLVALHPPAPRLAAELRTRLGVKITVVQAGQAIGAEIAYYREHLDEGRDAATLADLRQRCTEVLRRALPPCDEIAEADRELLQQALLASLRFSAFEDARPALELARHRGQRLVVVSNWDVSLHDVLQRIRLAPLLDGVVSSAEAGARKPAPEIFERALALVGVSAAQAIHVGDSLDEDLAGARATGIEPVLIARDGGPRPPGVRVIESLVEL